jgi:hypothetical protein
MGKNSFEISGPPRNDKKARSAIAHSSLTLKAFMGWV